jgi:hypothetical protein
MDRRLQSELSNHNINNSFVSHAIRYRMVLPVEYHLHRKLKIQSSIPLCDESTGMDPSE